MRALFRALGADFTKLWTASAVSNLGDGVTMVAGPLLVAVTHHRPGRGGRRGLRPAAAVAAVRPGQRRVGGPARPAPPGRGGQPGPGPASAVLAAAVAAGAVSVPLIYAVFFVLGTGETLADTASSAFVPAIVPADSLPAANSLLGATFTVLNQFAAKPLGGVAVRGRGGVAVRGERGCPSLLSAALIAGMRSVPAPPSSRPRRSCGRTSPKACAGSGVIACCAPWR